MPNVYYFDVPMADGVTRSVGVQEPTLKMLETMPADAGVKENTQILRQCVKSVGDKTTTAEDWQGDALTNTFGIRGFLILTRCLGSLFEVEEDDYEKAIASGKARVGG